MESFNIMVDSLQKKESEVSTLIGALRESEKRYRDLFDGAAEGILVVETTTKRFRYANTAICQMLGYTEAELTAMSITDIHPDDGKAPILSLFDSQLAGSGKTINSDIPFVHKDSSIIYMDLKSNMVSIDGITCVLGFFTDVTDRRNSEAERKVLESRLHRSEKMEAIGLLAGGVAHDLNNILSGLVSYPELLLIDLPENSPCGIPSRPLRTRANGQRPSSRIY